MDRYEYRIVPAPRRFGRVRAKGSDGKAAATLQAEIAGHAAEGWEYVRADTLPFDERSGLTQRTTVFHTVLVFRRRVPEARPALAPPDIGPSPGPTGDAGADPLGTDGDAVANAPQTAAEDTVDEALREAPLPPSPRP